MLKYFFYSAVFVLYSCSHNYTELPRVQLGESSRSIASQQEMNNVEIPESFNDKNTEKYCEFSKELNKASDKNKKIEILKRIAAGIHAESRMILSSVPDENFCGETAMMLDKTFTLIEESLCFQLALEKYYDLDKLKKSASFKEQQTKFLSILQDANKIVTFNTPLSAKCNNNYLAYFADKPLVEILPIADVFQY